MLSGSNMYLNPVLNKAFTTTEVVDHFFWLSAKDF